MEQSEKERERGREILPPLLQANCVAKLIGKREVTHPSASKTYYETDFPALHEIRNSDVCH